MCIYALFIKSVAEGSVVCDEMQCNWKGKYIHKRTNRSKMFLCAAEATLHVIQNKLGQDVQLLRVDWLHAAVTELPLCLSSFLSHLFFSR